MGGCSVQVLLVDDNETNLKVYASLARQMRDAQVEREALRGVLVRRLPSALTAA
jgi:hypothetical protein